MVGGVLVRAGGFEAAGVGVCGAGAARAARDERGRVALCCEGCMQRYCTVVCTVNCRLLPASLE